MNNNRRKRKNGEINRPAVFIYTWRIAEGTLRVAEALRACDRLEVDERIMTQEMAQDLLHEIIQNAGYINWSRWEVNKSVGKLASLIYHNHKGSSFLP